MATRFDEHDVAKAGAHASGQPRLAMTKRQPDLVAYRLGVQWRPGHRRCNFQVAVPDLRAPYQTAMAFGQSDRAARGLG